MSAQGQVQTEGSRIPSLDSVDQKPALQLPSDSNNNSDNNATSRNAFRTTQEQSTETLNCSRNGLKCQTTDVDDWQLLCMTDTEADNVETTKSTFATQQTFGDVPPACKAMVGFKSFTKSTGNKYLELDPLGDQNKYSPFLVHLCTGIYALMPLASLIVTFILTALLFTNYYYVTLMYLAYVLYNRNRCNQANTTKNHNYTSGGQRVNWVYQSKFWSYLAAYFPVRIRCTKDFTLNPNKNYILNYHPHGIAAFGSVTTFATNGLHFSKVFPGITSRFMVHETSFVVPVMRETFSFRGDCSVNSRSIDYMLSSRGTGNLLTLVGGGLAEADLSDMEQLKIVVAQRKGFVKKALIHGADIVPCIAFGENSVFHKVNFKPGSFMYRLESRWYSLFKFKHPVYYGRSLFSSRLSGVMPLKRPITLVLGDPIVVKQVVKPSQTVIDELHAKYMDNLREMYNSNQDLCNRFDKQLLLV